ncbi:hypothetical protein R8Z50_21515 [Longispora sp. K20-0274]|uniref:hypothetical protein n=1 Tax=Longispora sp. K20-0274 TaxID=3088255 RepID=UPI00399A0C2A
MPVACPDGCGTGLVDATAAVRAAVGRVFANATDAAIPDNGAVVTSTIAVAGVSAPCRAARRRFVGSYEFVGPGSYGNTKTAASSAG